MSHKERGRARFAPRQRRKGGTLPRNITEARIDHLSDLARLSLPGGEKEEIARELERILDYMAVLDGLDTAGAEPLSHVFPLKNVLRPDETAPSADRAALLAPAADGESFLVPNAVE